MTSNRLDDEPGVLERFLSDIAVDDYAHAAHRASRTDVRTRRPSTWVGLIVAAIVGLVIMGALLNTRLSTAERQETRAALSDRVEALSDAVAARQAAVDEQSASVQALQDRLLSESDAEPERAESIAALSALTDTQELAGSGVVLMIDDAPDAAAGSLNRVLDRDLQDIVNALWRESASGVEINGERLTGTTAIRAAGEAILVNYQPLNRPYVISAVSGAEVLADDSQVRRILAQLSTDYGLVTDIGPGDIALPAGDLRTLRYATTTPLTTGAGSE